MAVNWNRFSLAKLGRWGRDLLLESSNLYHTRWCILYFNLHRPDSHPLRQWQLVPIWNQHGDSHWNKQGLKLANISQQSYQFEQSQEGDETGEKGWYSPYRQNCNKWAYSSPLSDTLDLGIDDDQHDYDSVASDEDTDSELTAQNNNNTQRSNRAKVSYQL